MRRYEDDLAYGDIPQRWDRGRFERHSRGGSGRFEDDFRFVERDTPGRREVAIAEREKSRGPRGRFEERERFFEDERVGYGGRRRRTDRELFGDMDPREIAEMAVTPYRRRSIERQELDIDQRGPRPGLLRRQSSLDTFDRRPSRVEREERRLAPYNPIPLPIRREREYYEPEDYREVEIQRERSVHRRRVPRSEAGRSVREEIRSISKHESNSSSSVSIHEEDEKISVRGGRAASLRARSVRAPSIHESVHETKIEESVHAGSIHETDFEKEVREERTFKKGRTRMPKRLVRVEAVRDLGYPFDEEDDFIVLRIALRKEEIDEVISLSKDYRESKVYRYEDTVEEGVSIPAPPIGEREIVERTEWINPPSVVGERIGERVGERIGERRERSRIGRDRSRGSFVEERKSIVEESRNPPIAPTAFLAPAFPAPSEVFEERKTVVEERSPSRGALILADRETVTDRDINFEIRALEHERRALRLEREAGEKRDLALRIREQRPEEELGLVQYRERRPRGEYLELVERDRSEERNVVRVEKDRKGRLALVRSAH